MLNLTNLSGFGAGASANVEITFLGAFGITSTSFNIGIDRPDRIIVVAAQREDDTLTICPMPSINGSSPNVIDQHSDRDNMSLGYAVVPTGQTVNIANNVIRGAAWMITGVTVLDQAITNSGSDTTIALTATMPAKASGMIAIARSRANMSSGSASISGVMRDVSTDTSSTSSGNNSGWVCGSAYADGSGSGTILLSNGVGFSSGIAAAGVFK